ncbi:hypothetical protein GCM10009584_17200 [Ornithinimicrobium humiphilum]|uniref:Lipoprotein n=1 Tax=Ornithinimicrobium humiphilum TaxID=125288 RepID=A0A543KL53_9MICO|nr:hypothetical protein [Ornithinimicrobium humiphilum]TQM95813.1 hypothetical protein FB476_0663 [Ornithinimicrobium humiphilum]
MKALAGAVVAAAAVGLTACTPSNDVPVVAPQGPTAEATAVPTAEQALEAALYDDTAREIERQLAEPPRTPIDELSGSLRDTDGEVVVEVRSITQTEHSFVLHLQLRPAGDEPVDLGNLDGGLSGELGEGTRTIADVALVDESTDRRILPTVYRADVSTEDADQRCMCSSLPDVLPVEGVRLSAHYVRPEAGFRSMVVDVPGLARSRPMSAG